MFAPDREERWFWVRVGAQEGARLGAVWAGVWILIPLVLSLLWLLLSVGGAISAVAAGAPVDPQWKLPNFVLGSIFFLIFANLWLFMGAVFGVCPAFLIGATSGALLGAVLRLPHIAPYRWNRLAVGGGIALLIELVVSSPFVLQYLQLDLDPSINGPHLFFIGIPSLIYLGIALRISDRLPALAARESAAKKKAIKEYPLPDFYAAQENEELR